MSAAATTDGIESAIQANVLVEQGFETIQAHSLQERASRQLSVARHILQSLAYDFGRFVRCP
jgi:hypothetical protein